MLFFTVGACLHDGCYSIEVGGIAGVGLLKVGLVVGSYGKDVVAFSFDILYSTYNVVDVVATGGLIPHGSTGERTLLVAYVAYAAKQEDGLYACLHDVAELGVHAGFLLIGEGIVGLVEPTVESHTGNVKVLLAAVVALLVGKEVPAPATHAKLEFLFRALLGDVEGYTYCPWTGDHGTARCCCILRNGA